MNKPPEMQEQELPTEASDTIVLTEYSENPLIRRQGRYYPLSFFKRAQIQGEFPFPDPASNYGCKHNVSRLAYGLWRALGLVR